MKRVLFILFFWFIVSPVFASEQTGKVILVQVRDDGLHWFFLSGERTARPECATNYDYWMIKDENSTYGKSQMSILLLAHITGKEVHITGSGECTRWNDGEDIKTIQLR